MASQVLLGSLSSIIPLTLLMMNSSSGDNVANATTNNTSSSPLFSSLPIPPILLNLIIKNQDFIKLMVLGGLLETCRRYASSLWEWILSQFYFTVYFESTDETFEWMMAWLTQQGIWTTSRQMYITTATWGKKDKGVQLARQDAIADEDDVLKKRKLTFLPIHESQHWLKHRRTWISVVREKEETNDRWSSSTKEKLTVKIYCRDQRFVRTLLEDAKRDFGPNDEDTVSIYTPAHWGADWRQSSSRRKRPLHSIILEPEIKTMITDDCRDFLENEQWYIDRGIPYRRGYLLHGVPGSGKTSLIHSLAGELDLDVYVVSLSKKSFDDSDLLELISTLPGRCIALIEDIDVAFKSGKRTAVAGSEKNEDEQADQPKQEQDNGSAPQSGVTLSGLLNALDGIAAQEGRLLFATTNCVDTLDEALCRPGRLDIHVEFKNASRWQAKRLFECFFPPNSSDNSKENSSDEKKSSEVSSQFRFVPLTKEEASSLAEKFADSIPEGSFSVASLQGFLLRYKNQPYVAVETAPNWATEAMEKRALKARKETEDEEKNEAEKAKAKKTKKEAEEKEKNEAEKTKAEAEKTKAEAEKEKTEAEKTPSEESSPDEDDGKGRRKKRRRRNK